MELNSVTSQVSHQLEFQQLESLFSLVQFGIIPLSRPQPELYPKAGKYGDVVPI